MHVTTAEFIKNYGRLADIALGEPVTITKNGHDRLVVIGAGEYERLKRRDRQVIAAGQLSEADVKLIAYSKVSDDYDYLDEEVKDWKP